MPKNNNNNIYVSKWNSRDSPGEVTYTRISAKRGKEKMGGGRGAQPGMAWLCYLDSILETNLSCWSPTDAQANQRPQSDKSISSYY